MRVCDLLTRAAEWYDAPGSALRAAAAGAALGGFASGAQWMRLGLETLRGRPCPSTAVNYQRLGLIKYGLAGGVAQPLQDLGVAKRDLPDADGVLHLGGQVEQSNQVADGGAVQTQARGQLFLGHAEAVAVEARQRLAVALDGARHVTEALSRVRQDLYLPS